MIDRRRRHPPTTLSELNILFDNYKKGLVMSKPGPMEPTEGAFNRLQTPKDWRELEFVTQPGDGSIPLIWTFLAAIGMWFIGFGITWWWIYG